MNDILIKLFKPLSIAFFTVVFFAASNSSIKELEFTINQEKKLEAHYRKIHLFEKEKEEFGKWIQASASYPEIPSCGVIMVKNGEVMYMNTLRCSPDKLFMIASFTKTFTAISILQLAEKGMLSLDDHISRYIDVSFENPRLKTDPITIRQLLTHSSGLVDNESPEKTKGSMPFYIPEQKYPAGYLFSYCNQGYIILGHMIFEVTGIPLGDYVTHNIILPLEMKDSKAPDNTQGAAGIECSIRDLGNYLNMLASGGIYKKKRILSDRYFDEIFRESVFTPPGRNREYRGIAWRIWKSDGNIYSFNHAAHMDGAGGWMQIFPGSRVAYAFISNPPVYETEKFYGFYQGMKYRLLKLASLLMEDEKDPLEFTPTKPDGNDLKNYVGTYKNESDGSTINVWLNDNDSLFARKSVTFQQYPLAAMSRSTFVYIYPGQNEKGELFDFVWRNGAVDGLGAKEGYFIKVE